MKFYKLIYDYENDDNYINCSKVNLKRVNEYTVCNGTYVNEWEKDIIFDYDPKEANIKTDYIGNVYGWLIVSKRFRDVTKMLIEDSIQYLDVGIRDISNKNIDISYRIANVIDVVDAIDLKRSKYDEFDLGDEKVFSFEKYVLKEIVIAGHHIFKLKDDEIPTFVSEKIKNLIQVNNLIGFKFLEVEVY